LPNHEEYPSWWLKYDPSELFIRDNVYYDFQENILIKLKNIVHEDILKEYVHTDIMSLWRYLNMSLDEKTNDLLERAKPLRALNSLFEFGLHTLSDETNEDFASAKDVSDAFGSEKFTWEQVRQRFPYLMTDVFNFFKEQIRQNDKSFDGKRDSFRDTRGIYDLMITAKLPTWLYMKPVSLLKNQWLFHGTNAEVVDSILQRGFVGVDDYKMLGLTTHISDKNKVLDGFSFAYSADEIITGRATVSGGGFRYGDKDNIIMFRASAIVIYHRTDDEFQTIFKSNSTTDRVHLQRTTEDDTWNVMSSSKKSLYKSKSLKSVVSWVMRNYDQYRRQFEV